MKAGWKVGQASHGAYYGNKAAFHFLGKTTVAAVKVQGTEYSVSVWVMTGKIKKDRYIEITLLLWWRCFTIPIDSVDSSAP